MVTIEHPHARSALRAWRHEAVTLIIPARFFPRPDVLATFRTPTQIAPETTERLLQLPPRLFLPPGHSTPPIGLRLVRSVQSRSDDTNGRSRHRGVTGLVRPSATERLSSRGLKCRSPGGDRQNASLVKRTLSTAADSGTYPGRAKTIKKWASRRRLLCARASPTALRLAAQRGRSQGSAPQGGPTPPERSRHPARPCGGREGPEAAKTLFLLGDENRRGVRPSWQPESVIDRKHLGDLLGGPMERNPRVLELPVRDRGASVPKIVD